MEVTYSFLDPDSKKPNVIPTQLRLIKDICDRKHKVSPKLLKRCIKIKSSLNKFPRDIIKVKSLIELKDKPPWWYEPLTHKNYENLSSVRLTEGVDLIKGDRLIFKEFSDNKFIIIEELFHYLRDLDISKLKGTDLELHQLYSKKLKAPNIEEIINELSELSEKKNESKIWIFD